MDPRTGTGDYRGRGLTMVDWIRTIAIGGAIAAQGCVLEEGVLDDGRHDDDDDGEDDEGDDAPADESASYTSAAEDEESSDDSAPERIPTECGPSLDDACEALRDRTGECMGDEAEFGCDEVSTWFPQTSECCTALAEFMACVVAAPCDDDAPGCLLDPDGDCGS
jgi:hypothetical protein